MDFCVRDGSGSDAGAVRSTEAACPQLDWGNAESNRRTARTARPAGKRPNKNLLNSTTLIQAFLHSIETLYHYIIQTFLHSIETLYHYIIQTLIIR